MSTKTLNFNIGVLGHVDSGKTSLVKAISTTASTACFDKNPASKERGITLDLGFSSFQCPLPSHIADHGYGRLQVTLVDCPGHASLIKTIIGGSQIIDMMMLVIDVTKGMQTQTAECLVIGEIICKKMLVIINKIDLLPEDKRSASIEKMTKKLKLTFQKTKFKDVEIIPVSAKPGGPDSDSSPLGLTALVDSISHHAYVPDRAETGSALFSVDHCFSMKGQGTVLTGTLLQGSIKVGDMLEIPAVGMEKKVKSIQMFRISVDKIVQGDRAGVCLTQFDPSLVERGVVCTPGTVPIVPAVVAEISRIAFFKGEISSKVKFHISLGHETVLSKITLFTGVNTSKLDLDFSEEYLYQDSLEADSKEIASSSGRQLALLEFERLIPVVPDCVLMGSRLDTDINANMCRLAFHGKVIWQARDKSDYMKNEVSKLKVFKHKSKDGIVERVVNDQEVIVKDLFKKETNVDLFVGLNVILSTGECGSLEGSFGQSGKVKVRVMEGLLKETVARVGTGKKKGDQPQGEPVIATIKFKRYVFDREKKIIKV